MKFIGGNGNEAITVGECREISVVGEWTNVAEKFPGKSRRDEPWLLEKAIRESHSKKRGLIIRA